MKRVFSQLRFKGSGFWFFLRFITNELIQDKKTNPPPLSGAADEGASTQKIKTILKGRPPTRH